MSGPVAQIWKSLVRSKGFERVLEKVIIISANEGSCTAELKISDEHVNTNGTLHGGMTATIVDILSGLGLATHPRGPPIGVSVDIHISFLNAAPLGNEILIETKTNKVGRTLAFLDVLITDKTSGKVVATGTHTKYVGQ